MRFLVVALLVVGCGSGEDGMSGSDAGAGGSGGTGGAPAMMDSGAGGADAMVAAEDTALAVDTIPAVDTSPPDQTPARLEFACGMEIPREATINFKYHVLEENGSARAAGKACESGVNLTCPMPEVDGIARPASDPKFQAMPITLTFGTPSNLCELSLDRRAMPYMFRVKCVGWTERLKACEPN